MADLFDLPTTSCSSCNAPIIWATTINEKKIPLDAKPMKRMILDDRGIAQSVDTYMPHHATCPQGKNWRRPK